MVYRKVLRQNYTYNFIYMYIYLFILHSVYCVFLLAYRPNIVKFSHTVTRPVLDKFQSYSYLFIFTHTGMVFLTITEVIWSIMFLPCQSELNKTVFRMLLYCGGWGLMFCIHVLCRKNQSLVRDLWLSPCKMRRGSTCQDMSLMEEICFL